MNNQVLYQIALSFLPNVGIKTALSLIQQFSSAEQIFRSKKKELTRAEGVGEKTAQLILDNASWSIDRAKEEMRFMQKNHINSIFYTDEEYPQRLKNCTDPPLLLYKKGNADLNVDSILSIVGTRNSTKYGNMLCERLVQEVKKYNPTIVSGLAFGIDAIAHQVALQHNIRTIAVLGHGLDQVYPTSHKKMAEQMIHYGALLTEFPSGTSLHRMNFPRRNRIVAGMSDALIVVETDVKGGSMITAELANSYNKEVFAFPAAVTSRSTSGCNHLIKNHKASLIESSEDLEYAMRWNIANSERKNKKQVIENLSELEQKVIAYLERETAPHIDQLTSEVDQPLGDVSSTLLELELKGIIVTLPGKRYSLM